MDSKHAIRYTSRKQGETGWPRCTRGQCGKLPTTRLDVWQVWMELHREGHIPQMGETEAMFSLQHTDDDMEDQ